MISLEKKYLIMKKIIEYLRKKGGKALMTNIVGEVIYLADGQASWREIEDIVFELQRKGILEISQIWSNEYEVSLKKREIEKQKNRERFKNEKREEYIGDMRYE